MTVDGKNASSLLSAGRRHNLSGRLLKVRKKIPREIIKSETPLTKIGGGRDFGFRRKFNMLARHLH